MAGEAQILPNCRNTPKSTGPNSQKVLEIRSITLLLCALMVLWLKNPFNQRNLLLMNYLCTFGIFTLVKMSLQINLFMQNKANFRKSQMNVSNVITRDYGEWTLGERGKNKPNSNPIQTQFKANSNPIRTQFKPKQSQFQGGAYALIEWQNHRNIPSI